MAKTLFQRIKEQDKWTIGIVDTRVDNFVRSPKRHVHWMPEIPGKYYADPFVVERDGSLHIFCEEYNYLTEQSRIVYIEAFQKEGSFVFSKPLDIIDDGTNMSYPFLVEDDGELYCIPETSQKNEIALYKCVKFPLIWQKETVLKENFPGVDATVVSDGKKWWMFTTILGKHNEELWTFHAKNLKGPWKQHALNPVKNDSTSARPAGKPYVSGNTIYRPTQNCEKTFGAKIVVNKITHLTPSKFAEETHKEIKTLKPYAQGLHTISHSGEFTVIDGKRWADTTDIVRKSWPAILRKTGVRKDHVEYQPHAISINT